MGTGQHYLSLKSILHHCRPYPQNCLHSRNLHTFTPSLPGNMQDFYPRKPIHISSSSSSLKSTAQISSPYRMIKLFKALR